jgi:ATP-binding cassette, subfamily B, heavy metal transporter
MYASNQVLLGLLTIGGFVQINGYLLQFTLPASYFGYIVMETRRALVSLCTFTSVMNKPLPVQNRSNKLFLTPPSISLSDVCFSYPNSPLILRDISFNVQPGDFIAIVGRSGSGKSTLLKLLLRLYTASSGKILINGVSILDFSPDSLRHSIGYVTQEAQLFNRTLYENITYGNQRESRASAQEILGAVQLIHLENYLDAPVGENGSCLSGGERQRVAISRALGHQPQLLLLDEPSSALDARTEGLIINRLLRESRATKLVVTHRIASIQTATRILVMDKGSIVEQGTHEVLLRASGLYLELWRKQHGTDKLT